MSALFLLLKDTGSEWEFSLPTARSFCVEPGFLGPPVSKGGQITLRWY